MVVVQVELCLYPTPPCQCVDRVLTLSAGSSPCLPLLLALIKWSNIEEGETVVCSSMFCDQLLVDTANPQLSRLLILWTIVSASKSLYTSLQCFTRHSFGSHTMATVSVKEL